MKITVHSSKLVKPAYGGATAAHAVNTGETIPLTVFDKASFDTYVSGVLAYRAPAPPNAVLEAGLARALAVYRVWAGRLGVDAGGNRVIVLSDAGMRFVEATADVPLDAAMPLEPGPEVRRLHPSGDGAVELRLVQVTRFACGSLVLGTTSNHVVADGRAAYTFSLAWAQATRVAAIHPAPVHGRASFFAPRDPPRVEFAHRGAEFKRHDEVAMNGADAGEVVVIHKVSFSREFVSKLRLQASAGATRQYSTLKCVVAHLWRRVTTARGLADGDGTKTSVRIAVDGRARMRPPVPDGYTGNVVLWARPTTTARQLLSMPLRHAVELIDREVARIDDGYFKSFIDFASSGVVEEERLVPTADAAEMALTPNIEVDSLLGIPFDGLDFGGGRPFLYVPGYLPSEGSIFIAPSLSDDGSVDAYVPLFRRDMDAFKKCCYSLAAPADARL